MCSQKNKLLYGSNVDVKKTYKIIQLQNMSVHRFYEALKEILSGKAWLQPLKRKRK